MFDQIEPSNRSKSHSPIPFILPNQTPQKTSTMHHPFHQHAAPTPSTLHERMAPPCSLCGCSIIVQILFDESHEKYSWYSFMYTSKMKNYLAWG
jgi:hypothetical protein